MSLILTFSWVWSWQLLSSRSAMVFLNHYFFTLVYNPSSTSSLCRPLRLFCTLSYLLSHQLPLTLPFSLKTYEVSVFLLSLSQCLQYLCSWPTQYIHTHNAQSSGADCITTTKYLAPSYSGFPVAGLHISTLLNSVWMTGSSCPVASLSFPS